MEETKEKERLFSSKDRENLMTEAERGRGSTENEVQTEGPNWEEDTFRPSEELQISSQTFYVFMCQIKHETHVQHIMLMEEEGDVEQL